jgi:hypothetical protein
VKEPGGQYDSLSQSLSLLSFSLFLLLLPPVSLWVYFYRKKNGSSPTGSAIFSNTLLSLTVSISTLTLSSFLFLELLLPGSLYLCVSECLCSVVPFCTSSSLFLPLAVPSLQMAQVLEIKYFPPRPDTHTFQTLTTQHTLLSRVSVELSV